MKLEAIAQKNAPGVLVSFEGGDGSGKSTHIRFLAELLESFGFEVVLVREPGGTHIGEQLREIVLDVSNTELSARSELLIYEAARAQLVDEVIKPALASGAIVLCDRFTDSTLAYQGYGRNLPLDFIRAANAFATDGITPDVTIVLWCANRAEKKDRVDRRIEMDRLELAGDDFHTNVIEAFTTLAKLDPDRIKVIETGGKHSETARMIFDALTGVFPWLSDGTLDLTEVLAKYDARHDHTRKNTKKAAGDAGPNTEKTRGAVHG